MSARVSKFKKEIFAAIVKENGGTIRETQRVVESSLQFTRQIIEKGEFAQVRLPYFGNFMLIHTD